MKWSIVILLFLAFLAVLTHIWAGSVEQRHPAVGAFAEIDGLRMHYTDTGAGSAIVLIHGASTSLLDFQASIAEHLKVDHRVITVDRPGHGYSDRPSGDWPDPAEQARLIRELMRDLEIDKPVMVGHSWSGSVVLAYLLDYPNEAMGGVLIAGGSHPWTGGVAWYNDVAGVPLLGELFARTLVYPLGRLSLTQAIKNVFSPDPVPTEYLEQTGVQLSLRPNTFLANAQDIRMLSDYLAHQSKRYASITHPVLALTGEKDDLVPTWNHAERLARQLPNMEHVTFTNAGHALHHSHPERVAGLIASFSRRLTARVGKYASGNQTDGRGQISVDAGPGSEVVGL